MPKLNSLRSFAVGVKHSLLRAVIHQLDPKSQALLVKQIIRQLDHDDAAFLANRLAPDISLRMGIPIPLASPLTNNVYDVKVEDVLDQCCKDFLGLPESRTLDLGCGLAPRNPFRAETVHGVDIRGQDGSDIYAADLFNDPIPFGNEYFDYVTAYDFIEHVPRTVCEQGMTRFPFVLLMNEIWRVLKPGGLFMSYTPAFPSQQVFQDPTHVNPVSEHTFPLYFCQCTDKQPLAQMYGFRSYFKLISQQRSNFYLITVMAKPDSIQIK
jgi:SAM-dependent methyltransferase